MIGFNYFNVEKPLSQIYVRPNTEYILSMLHQRTGIFIWFYWHKSSEMHASLVNSKLISKAFSKI